MHADAVVMAAAVADFRPAARSETKIKKSGSVPEPIALTENPDILRELVHNRDIGANKRPGQVIVGFGAETGDILDTGLRETCTEGVRPAGRQPGRQWAGLRDK